MYNYRTQIRLHDTDAAGLLFFANQFKILHDAYESLLQKIGFGFEVMLRDKTYFLPIVHAESDYKAPLFVADGIVINVRIANIGVTSFTFDYTVTHDKGHIVGTGKTVHVTMDKKTQRKIPIPDDFRQKLEELSRNGS